MVPIRERQLVARKWTPEVGYPHIFYLPLSAVGDFCSTSRQAVPSGWFQLHSAGVPIAIHLPIGSLLWHNLLDERAHSQESAQ
jgi:hypothetical protein